MLKNNPMKNIIKGIIIFLIFWNSVYFQYIPVYLFKLNISELSMVSKCLLSLFSSIVVLIIFFIIYRKDLKSDFYNFRRNFFRYSDVAFKYWFIGLVIMMASNIVISLLFNTSGANNEHALQELIKSAPFVMFFTAAIIGPINEEIVFRKTLLDIFNNKWVISFLSFFLFGMAHVISSATVWTDYLYIIPYGSLGFFFAYADCKTNNLMTSISMHMLHNTILLVISIMKYI
jgi:hypothetical protein